MYVDCLLTMIPALLLYQQRSNSLTVIETGKMSSGSGSTSSNSGVPPVDWRKTIPDRDDDDDRVRLLDNTDPRPSFG